MCETKKYLFNFILFFLFGVATTQLLPFLKAEGYSEIERGIIFSFHAVFAIITQILAGILCDYRKSIKKIFFSVFLLFVSFVGFVYYFKSNSFLLTLFLTGFLSAFGKCVTSLNETWMFYLNQRKYGLYRCFAALGLGFSSLFIGILLFFFSYKGIVYVTLLLFIILLYLYYSCEDIQWGNCKNNSFIKSIIHNKQYMYMLLVFFLIYLSGSCDQFVVIDKMMSFDASSFLIGIKWAIQSFLEIPFFFFAYKVLKRYSCYQVLKFALLSYFIKFILYALSPSSFFIIASSTLQIFTLPVVAYSGKLIFSSLLPSLKASSQMFAMAICMGLSAFVSYFLSGFLCFYLGINITLYIIAFSFLIPYLLIVNRK